MKILIFLFSLMLSTNISGQMNWVTDYNVARKKCKEAGKLMVIDFWADWCKPCNVMDKELWSNSRFSEKDFIALKVDVDQDKVTTDRFEITGLPTVIIAMSDGTVLWKKIGFNEAESFLNVLNSIPVDVSNLYRCYYDVNAMGKSSKCAFDIAVEFQRLAAITPNKELRSILLDKNTEFFKKALKYNTAPELNQDVELYLLLNETYSAKPEKIIQKFNKSFGSAEKCRNKDLAHFLLANCYYQMNDEEKFSAEIAVVLDHALLEQMEFRRNENKGK
jgi:thiol-disulfide isomerase/thioredoxin